MQNAPAPAATEAGAVIAVQVEPVIVESGPLEPSREQLAQRFRDLLAEPPTYVASERQIASGLLEVRTSVGRFCVRSAPQSMATGVGGSVTLAAPCFPF